MTANLAMALAFILALSGACDAAADTLRVGRSPAFLFAYTPLDVGIAKGFFASRGLMIERISFDGAARGDAAIVAGAIDLYLGSPMGMAMEVKGLPAIGVAVIAGPMVEFGILVPYDSSVRSLDDLKGKTLGIATVGSITQWVGLELERVKGWGPDGIKMTSIGSSSSAGAAALKAHLVDATIGNATLGLMLEREKDGRLLATAADFVAHFMAHEMFATRSLMRDNPDAIRRFLAGWLESVAFMRANRSETIAIARTATGLSEADQAVEYDHLMAGISRDGRFDPRDVERIRQSFVELGLLDREPDMADLYTEDFLPR
jgi:NitT/TauT family transport system substrate-binding protein